MRSHTFDEKKQSGFSMVELLMVVAIILVVSAVAVPNLLRMMNAYRLRGAAHNQAELIQRARMEALRDNRIKHVWNQWTWDGSTWRTAFFLDSNGNWWQDANETAGFQLPSYMFWGWGPSTATMNLDFTPQNTWNLPSFDSRGIPCQFNSASDCPTLVGGQPVGFVFFLTDYETGWWGSPTGFAAVSVSPSGKVKTWTWSGTRWE